MSCWRRIVWVWVATSVALFAIAGCSSDPKPFVPAPVDAKDVFNIAIIGDSASAFREGVAYRKLWPSQFVTEALPQSSTLFNLSGRFNTAERATRRSVPLLATVKPAVVVIWLGFDDVAEGIDPTAYAQAVSNIVQSALDAGATTVLVGTLPAALDGSDPYNAALVRSIGTDATIVDVAAVNTALETQDGRLVPDVESLTRIAATFANAYRSVTSKA